MHAVRGCSEGQDRGGTEPTTEGGEGAGQAAHLGAAVRAETLVHEHGFHGVAGGRVVRLGVDEEAQGLFHISRLVHEGVADAVGVPQHRDGAVSHHGLHEGRAAPRNDEIDKLRAEGSGQHTNALALLQPCSRRRSRVPRAS